MELGSPSLALNDAEWVPLLASLALARGIRRSVARKPVCASTRDGGSRPLPAPPARCLSRTTPGLICPHCSAELPTASHSGSRPPPPHPPGHVPTCSNSCTARAIRNSRRRRRVRRRRRRCPGGRPAVGFRPVLASLPPCLLPTPRAATACLHVRGFEESAAQIGSRGRGHHVGQPYTASRSSKRISKSARVFHPTVN